MPERPTSSRRYSKNVFSVEDFTYTSNGSSASNTSLASTSYSEHKSNTGAIVGGVVGGGVGGLTVLAGFAFFLVFRRRRRAQAADLAAASATKRATGQKLPMYDYTKAADINQVFQELPPSGKLSPAATEAFNSPVYEAPDHSSEAHELA